MVFLADVQRWYDYYRISNVEEYCRRTGMEYREPNLSDLFISVSDALIAAQNVVIAAESLGIGSCYIGDVMENYEIHRELLGLPEYAFPIAMLCLGYYPDDHKPIVRPRFDQQYFVFEEKYHRLNAEELTAMFAELEASIPRPNKYAAENAAQYTFALQDRSSLFTGDGPLHPQSTGELAGRAALIRNHHHGVLRCLCQLLGHGCIV